MLPLLHAGLQFSYSYHVHINQKMYNNINKGLVIFLGIHEDDTINDIHYLIDKIIHLRIFNNTDEKMHFSITDINGDILLISQFTLLANIKKGRRPSFTESANPDLAKKLYAIFTKELQKTNLTVKTGKFGSLMDIKLNKNGPATFILNSHDYYIFIKRWILFKSLNCSIL